MSNVIDFIKRAFIPGDPFEPLSPGLYHYISPPDDPDNYRLHLRIEENGSGLMIINASTVLHLNQTAAEFAYYLIKQIPEDEAIKAVMDRYQVSYAIARNDYENLREQIDTLINTPDLDPVTYLDIERQVPYTDTISAPYRLDIALTYQVPEGSSPEDAPTKRVDRELTTEEWQQILAKAWQSGIPHMIFTGGEPTLRADLPDLIAFAENQGQVTGLLTDGLKLGESEYLQSLLLAGLDHTMIVLQPDRDNTWESLASFAYWAETMDEDLFVAVHLTLTHDNLEQFPGLIQKLADSGISALSISASSKDLSDALVDAQDQAYNLGIELVWDTPVPYSRINPIALELANQEEETSLVEGAGRGWLYVEPDGDVLPGQGINQILGNLLTDDWETIWQAAKEFRESN